jgi:uncharacterized protein YbjT (DUF2867 family)
MKAPLILVAGATGTVGRETVKQLADGGHNVRALARDPAKAKFDKAVEVVTADLLKSNTLADAFAGVNKAFVITNYPEIEKLEANAFDAAKKAGVAHVVKLSAQESFQDHLAGTAHSQTHINSERRLRESGLSWTMLRPGFFSSNFLFLLNREEGAVFLPAGAGKEAPIHPRDIAAVAVKALTTPGHEGKIYDLTGPELLSYAEMTEKMSTVTGRRIRYVDVTEEEARAGLLAAGFPPILVDGILGHYAGVKAGRISLASGVRDALGREALTFDEWLRDNAAALK